MRSIVVVGDVRAHMVQGENGPPLQTNIYGGCVMMSKAIRQCLESLDLLTPEVLTFEYGADSFSMDGTNDDSVSAWKAAKRIPDNLKTERFHLTPLKPVEKICIPRPASLSPLTTRLIHGRFGAYPLFEGNLDLTHMLDPDVAAKLPRRVAGNNVPDVIVVDDLGLKVGRMRYNDDLPNPLEDSKTFEMQVGASFEQLKQSLDAFGISRDASQIKAMRTSSDELLKLTFKAITARLTATANGFSRSGRCCPIEPVVLMSIAKTIPDLRPSPSNADERTFAQHLHDNDALRRRTIVLFDAFTLRDQISISSGLSWERTAQDTIVEFRRNRKLRAYLKFGYIIIRFGLTGALLIANDGNDLWTNTLYFNPDQDDAMWTHHEEGKVLGATSVLAATIVEQLSLRCQYRDGKALLPDLRHALDQSLLRVVNRLLNHFEFGFGQDDASFAAHLNTFPNEVFLPRSKVINQETLDENLTQLCVQRVKLLPFRSRYWSILAQSCQSKINEVAQDIVLHGHKVVLNTLEGPVDDFVRIILWHLLDQPPRVFLFGLGEHGKPTLDEMIKNSFAETLRNHKHAIRRMIGDSFFRSLKRLTTALIDDDSRECKSLKELNARVHDQCTRFDQRWSAFKTELGDEYRALLKERNSGQLKEAFACLDDEQPRDDGRMADAFRQIAEVINGWVDFQSTGKSDNRRWQNAIRALASIEEERLHDPRALIHEKLVELIRDHEPTEGWASPVSTPVLRLGRVPGAGQLDKRLVVIDRKEVESIRAVKRMIEQYLRGLQKSTPARPLSIAVFGPPGAGKTIAVKKVVEMMEGVGEETVEIPVNLSQLPNVEALEEKLKEIVQKIADKKVPIVFFDEFDSPLGDKKQGWLKYFLSLMEDGERIKGAVFVFAGGTCDTFEEFSLSDSSSSRSDPQWAKFAENKGPDFVSRLSGHINIVGINPASPDDDLYLIRRALTLRFFLSELQALSDMEEARIDPNMVNAFLHVPHYIHGARSMRMLTNLCLNRNDNRISMSEVPPIHQLNMQVDGKAFAALASGQAKPVLELEWSDSTE